MLRELIVVIVALTLVTAKVAPKECESHKQWLACGTSCPPTCGLPDNRPCILECIPGCHCQPGSKVKGNNCVLPSEC
ncbi:chymotrypsin inhibitor-like [Hylaeus volcanicus]|uniref:chymotrypsin inhibitor-like n=1 Tax=Hylaeus volcanicus TaxID=313075 RepID=UPI0023B7C148|nr:chymotrypsin inhibitor-like [Hylaeus volcanicus]